MLFPVFFDTCTLYGALVSDLVLRFAENRLYTPYWSQGVLDELERVLGERIGKISRQAYSPDEVCVPDALVCGYENLVPGMQCSEEDRHVLAAACHSPAETLVTFNVADFPSAATEPVGIEVKHPDDFLLDVFDLDPGEVGHICVSALRSYRQYPVTPEEFAELLARSGVPRFAGAIYPSLDAAFFDVVMLLYIVKGFGVLGWLVRGGEGLDPECGASFRVRVGCGCRVRSR